MNNPGAGGGSSRHLQADPQLQGRNPFIGLTRLQMKQQLAQLSAGAAPQQLQYLHTQMAMALQYQDEQGQPTAPLAA